MALRIVAGVQFEDKPPGRSTYGRESVRWRTVVDGILDVDEGLPANAYVLHAALMDVYVKAVLEWRTAVSDEGGGESQMAWPWEARSDP